MSVRRKFSGVDYNRLSWPPKDPIVDPSFVPGLLAWYDVADLSGPDGTLVMTWPARKGALGTMRGSASLTTSSAGKRGLTSAHFVTDTDCGVGQGQPFTLAFIATGVGSTNGCPASVSRSSTQNLALATLYYSSLNNRIALYINAATPIYSTYYLASNTGLVMLSLSQVGEYSPGLQTVRYYSWSTNVLYNYLSVPFAPGPLAVGGIYPGQGGSYTGLLHAVMLFDHVLTRGEWKIVEAYSSQQYGATI